MSAYNARVDKNQKEIVKKFRELGFVVAHTYNAGRGYPDINVGMEGITVLGKSPELLNFLRENKIPYVENATLLVEIKAPGGKLTPSQVKFREEWTGNYLLVVTEEDVEEILKCNSK